MPKNHIFFRSWIVIQIFWLAKIYLQHSFLPLIVFQLVSSNPQPNLPRNNWNYLYLGPYFISVEAFHTAIYVSSVSHLSFFEFLTINQTRAFLNLIDYYHLFTYKGRINLIRFIFLENLPFIGWMRLYIYVYNLHPY